ncbi:MAG: DUF456 domain-containing protein [Polaribacter sp.]|jgi:uncharacterized protein YqgC (DUF456 family)|nr:DUF456 domain-containing protein [Polaribacter sp.]MDG1953829.1 DUF456 domain-containing protein [Polaribacter sp.]MDG2074257.1 DUF456 domain-containing protein [Polaribacter sp.]
MDLLLLFLGLICMILGIIGAFLPILPGPLTGWLGLLLLSFTSVVPKDWTFLGITLAVAILVWILDYFIPAMGTKRFGGSKYGVYGTTIGLILGLLSPIPFGMLIGAFVGAFIGETVFDKKKSDKALKASFGSLLGFFVSASLKFGVGLVYFWFFISSFWEYKSVFF